METCFKRAVITGATGTIGTALIRELINNNIEVLVICRQNSQRAKNIPVHNLVKTVYCSLDRLSDLNLPSDDKYDVFYHFAWDGTFGDSRNNVYRQHMNIKYALDAVELAKRLGCHTFIGAGSQAEYGRCETTLTDTTKTYPENAYGMAKLATGFMTREFAHQLGIKHIWVRILSVFGPNDGSETMIMSTISKLQNNESPKLTKCEQKWDYLFSYDAATAFRLLGIHGKDGETYVLGGGEEHMLSYYVKTIRDIVNPKMDIDFGAIPYREKQVMYLCADISKISRDTGWQPKLGFEYGIKEILRSKKDD